MRILQKFIETHPIKPSSGWLSKLVILLEVALVAYIFRLLDKGSYLLLFNLGVLPKHPAVTIKLIFLLSTISTLALVICLVGLQRWHKTRIDSIGLSRRYFPTSRQFAVLVILAALGQLFVGALLGPWLEQIFNVPKSTFEVQGLGNLLLSFFIALIGGGFREEIFFRGYIVSQIRNLIGSSQKIGLIVAFIAQIFLFGLSHWYQGPVGIIETGTLAIMCSMIYLVTGSLWASIIFHSVYDIFGFTLIYLRW